MKRKNEFVAISFESVPRDRLTDSGRSYRAWLMTVSVDLSGAGAATVAISASRRIRLVDPAAGGRLRLEKKLAGDSDWISFGVNDETALVEEIRNGVVTAPSLDQGGLRVSATYHTVDGGERGGHEAARAAIRAVLDGARFALGMGIEVLNPPEADLP